MQLYATPGTHAFLKSHDIKTVKLHKLSSKQTPTAATHLAAAPFGLMVSVPGDSQDTHDAYKIRRLAVDNHIPLQTNAATARLLLRCLTEPSLVNRTPRSWQDFVALA
jgi:hypothetical protein